MREHAILAVLALPFQEESAIPGRARGGTAVTWTAIPFTLSLAFASSFALWGVRRQATILRLQLLQLRLSDRGVAFVAAIAKSAATPDVKVGARRLPSRAVVNAARGVNGRGSHAPRLQCSPATGIVFLHLVAVQVPLHGVDQVFVRLLVIAIF